ncbi:hypothetical protein BN946_scf184414.g2 [Trametes cinnabarina]|uniref:Fungal-type protein kinase domain-containing protein n=1 Tax=Pycnoporus cinnabarinus TaxID=5643 RepID=A0A060SPQ0_PYCCI|nr:hypothetical protein BN946_scf184414.g2 [Trametes cinnabarina]
MSDILEGPTASWLQCYTSNCMGESEVDQIISALKNDGLVLGHNGTLRWRDLPDKPSVLHQPEKVNQQSIGQEDGYEEEPLYVTASELLGSADHFDGSLRLINFASPPAPKRSEAAMADIVVDMKFKCNDKPEDISDVTIEDNHVSLWYFSRSHSAKSRGLDLLDVRAVVRALSALIFSTVEDLGYDSDIRRIVEKDQETQKDQIRYVYHVGDRFFKTLRCRDEYDHLHIVGRATRVWEVVEVAGFDDTSALPNAQLMVLRDVWLEHGSSTEREIQHMIFERCDELGRDFPAPNDDRLHDVDDALREVLRQRLKDGSYRELFLTIEHDHRGALSKPLATGFTPVPDGFFDLLYIYREVKRAGSGPRQVSTPRTSDPPVSPIFPVQQASAAREYKPRQHNFIVYREVCSALHELEDLHDVVQALLDALLALQILFMISWIHRDLSTGNILFYRGRGKLGDLEYAKEFNLSVGRRSSDPKTGTYIFMAFELHAGVRVYQDASYSEDIDAIDQLEAPTPASLAIRHNFQHDVESIFWILTWLVFTHIPGQNCVNAAAAMFHSGSPEFVTSRLNFLTNHVVCHSWLATLRPDLPPILRKGLLAMRVILHKRYINRGNSIGDISSYSPIYGRIRERLEAITASVPQGAVCLVRPPPPQVGVRSGYAPYTETLSNKMDAPEDHMLAPHKAASLKRARGSSDADTVSEQSRAGKRSARG